VIEMYLMVKYIRLGPSSLRTGRYFREGTAQPLRDADPHAAKPAEAD